MVYGAGLETRGVLQRRVRIPLSPPYDNNWQNSREGENPRNGQFGNVNQ